jgi:hypothetical protein
MVCDFLSLEKNERKIIRKAFIPWMALNRLKNQLNRKNGKRRERKRMGSLNGGSVKIR